MPKARKGERSTGNHMQGRSCRVRVTGLCGRVEDVPRSSNALAKEAAHPFLTSSNQSRMDVMAKGRYAETRSTSCNRKKTLFDLSMARSLDSELHVVAETK